MTILEPFSIMSFSCNTVSSLFTCSYCLSTVSFVTVCHVLLRMRVLTFCSVSSLSVSHLISSRVIAFGVLLCMMKFTYSSATFVARVFLVGACAGIG